MVNSKSVVDSLNLMLFSVRGSLSESEVSTIQEYIDVGEWKLAIETLCTFLYEKNISVSRQSYRLIEKAGESLGIDIDTWKILELPEQSEN